MMAQKTETDVLAAPVKRQLRFPKVSHSMILLEDCFHFLTSKQYKFEYYEIDFAENGMP